MNIGLLQCDHVDDEFLHFAGDYSDMFITLFTQYAPAITFKVYDIQKDQYPQSLSECHGYISTGSRYSAYDTIPWILRFKEFVQELYWQQYKFVGICFGHHIIAEALGGRCTKSTKNWGIGIKQVNIMTLQRWMSPPVQCYNLIVSHQDQIEQLPKKGKILGSNTHCPYSMISINEQFLGIQAHPEIPACYIEQLMLSKRDRIGTHLVEKARKTLSQNTHEGVIAQWIACFFDM
jgi:GMP synthase-like glutamine amidotransferase